MALGSKSVNGPPGGQGTVERQALPGFLITTVITGFAEDIFSVQLNSQKNLWLKLTRDYVNLKRPALRLDFFHLFLLPTSDQC